MNKNNRNNTDKSQNFSLSTQGKANMTTNNSTTLTTVQYSSQVCHLPHHPRYLTLVLSSSQYIQYHNTQIWYIHSSTTDLHFSVSSVPIPKNPLTWLFMYILKAYHLSIFSRFAGICHEQCMACVINLSWQHMFGDH
jgi:hypothetical protein